ncbi:NlpC/P60 family protein [Nocardia sp. NPDC051030]|uniref:C40 family peptidase n=1 Tax=Nocardia sp. NPDC051030 TaxID=3155162 RepID=UPI00341C4BC5
MTGVLGAAAVGAALLFTAGEAEATPVNVPGIGAIEIPDQIAAQFGIAAPAMEFAPREIPVTELAAGEGLEFRPVTIPGVGDAEASRMVSVMPEAIPAPAESATPAQSAAPAPTVSPEFRSVVVTGLGEFFVPKSIPTLTGIPGLTDAAAVPAPMPVVTLNKTTGQRAVEAARSKLGAYYSSGAVGPDAFDCSGFVQWSYRQAGVELPRTSYSQLAAGTPVPLDQLEPGDLVSFYGGGHSAMYVGDGQVIHATTYGQGVQISPIDNMPVSGARRF